MLISDTVSTISELPTTNLVRSYSSLDSLNKYASEMLGGNLTRSYNSLDSVINPTSDILNSKLMQINTSLDGLNKSNFNRNLFRSNSISYSPNIKSNFDINHKHNTLGKKSKDHNNNIKPGSFDIT